MMNLINSTQKSLKATYTEIGSETNEQSKNEKSLTPGE